MENSSINVNFEPVENEKDQEAVIEAVLFTIGGAVELRQLAAAIGQDKETICDIYGPERFLDITDLRQLPVRLVQIIARYL